MTLKNINIKVDDSTLDDLKFIQSYYSSKFGVSFTQKETIAKLLDETANLIKNTGETYPGRKWDLVLQEEQNYREYIEREKEEKSAKKNA